MLRRLAPLAVRADHARLARLAAVTALALGVSAAACSPSNGSGGGDASLIVGVQSQDFGPLVGSVRMIAKVDGAVASDQTVKVGPTAPPGGLPKELALSGALGANVDVEVDAFAPNAAPGAPPVVSRLASSHLLAGPTKKLLRVMLESSCAVFPPPGAPGGGATAPGAPGGPASCAAPLTCIAGQCAPIAVPDASLEDYDPGWAAAPPDICRPATHGAPEVVLGLGQLDYAPVADEQTVDLEEGPQGGHHVWVAVRMRNLRQSGSTTLITSRVLDDPSLVVPPSAFVFTFDRDEGSYCKLYGLRYQVDAGAVDLVNAYKPFLGKRLEITVTVTDSLKNSASSTKVIHLGDELICRDGSDTCNQPR
jgi:hypothetical protein